MVVSALDQEHQFVSPDGTRVAEVEFARAPFPLGVGGWAVHEYDRGRCTARREVLGLSSARARAGAFTRGDP